MMGAGLFFSRPRICLGTLSRKRQVLTAFMPGFLCDSCMVHNAFRCCIPPGGLDRLAHNILLRRLEMNAGRAAASPRAFHRDERVRIVLGKVMLVLGRELDHAASLVRIAERGEDFSGDAEV